MSYYEIEIGNNYSASICNCCNKQSCIGHGFVYKDGDAYAVYYAGWSREHPEKKITFAIAIGDWDEGSSCIDRTSFGLEASANMEAITFRVIEPSESPWASTNLLGPMLARDMGIHHPNLKEIFTIAETIILNHPAIIEYLSS